MINFKIEKKYNNKKIVNILTLKYPMLKTSIIYKALRKKDILVNGKRIKENVLVFENDEITAYIPDSAFSSDFKLDIIFEDENILVINKPSGISVTDDIHNDKTLSDYVKKYCKTASPCHRLDRNTSGLIIYAKNDNALNILLDKFKKREINKYYVCLAYGIFTKKQETLTAYLFKDTKKSMVYISDTLKSGYQKIITSYKVLDENKKKNISLLEIKLETGRTHQIRAHLAHIGHPIIGDGKYGKNDINKQFKEKHQILISYKLKFSFKTDADILNYLNGKEIKIDYKNLEEKVTQ